jgi:hypothetical protein
VTRERSASTGEYVFKIRDRTTGLFSCGGNPPKWSKHGKAWPTLGQLKAHLALRKEWSQSSERYEHTTIPFNWEIVVYRRVPETNVPVNWMDDAKITERQLIEIINAKN